MNLPTLHIVCPFFTVPNQDHLNAHDPFGQKARRFSKMMQAIGYPCVEYANEGSTSEAYTKVEMLSQEELYSLGGPINSKGMVRDAGMIGSPIHKLFSTRLTAEMAKFVRKNDIVCHCFGPTHQHLLKEFPQAFHVEIMVGYPTAAFGAHRIFDSLAYMHWHYGKEQAWGSDYDCAIPTSYDVEDWPFESGVGEYFLSYGRLVEEKGQRVIMAIADHVPVVRAGWGDPAPFKHPNIKDIGPQSGPERARLLGRAKALLMPTRYIEPFGGAGVEAQLCGTPILTSDFGCFLETVEHGVSGYRCRTLGDWLTAMRNIDNGAISRLEVHNRAKRLYAPEVVGKQYDKIFRQISELQYSPKEPRGSGWSRLPEWMSPTRPSGA